MLTDDDLRRVLAAVGAEAPVRALEVTASTNATALEMARAGTPPWTLVTADHQTAGRGREARTWVDVPGGSLLCSVVVPPVAPWGLVSLLAGASMAEAVRDVAGVDARCTWPNDVLVDGEKVCGILVESVVEGGDMSAVVVGAGLNFVAPPVDGAGAIGEVDPVAILVPYLRGLRDGVADPASIRTRWLAINDTIGREVGGAGLTLGTAVDVGEDGSLTLRTGSGTVAVSAGEITHLS